MRRSLTNISRTTNLFLPLIAIGVLIALFVGYIAFTSNNIGKPCGGFAANLPEYQCPLGLRCRAEGSYPDAGGTCQHIWPLSLITRNISKGTNFPSSNSTNTESSAVTEGQFCGGIANIVCPEGYRCELEGDYPDAGGKCVKF